jgi:hypothetical protein
MAGSLRELLLQCFWMPAEWSELRRDRRPGEPPASLPLPCQGTLCMLCCFFPFLTRQNRGRGKLAIKLFVNHIGTTDGSELVAYCDISTPFCHGQVFLLLRGRCVHGKTMLA